MDYETLVKLPKHHAYLIFDNNPVVGEYKNTIVYRLDTSISIEDSKRLGELSVLSSEETKRVILIAPGITREAQNALLKTVEDPIANISFFFIFPKGTEIIETIRSRCFVIDEMEEVLKDIDGEKFLEKKSKDRLDVLDKIWKLDGIERRNATSLFIKQMENSAHINICNDKKVNEVRRLLKALKNIDESNSEIGFTKTSLYAFAFV